MNKRIIPLAALAMMAGGSAVAQSNDTHRNPFLSPYTTPYQIPPFEQITYDDYLPALEAGITQAKANIEAIVNNPATPTFDNTILALDRSSDILDKVVYVFSALDESNNSPEMVAIAEKFYPRYSQYSDEVSMNPGLFKRVKYLYDNRDKLGLADDQKLAVEKSLSLIHI